MRVVGENPYSSSRSETGYLYRKGHVRIMPEDHTDSTEVVAKPV